MFKMLTQSFFQLQSEQFSFFPTYFNPLVVIISNVDFMKNVHV